MSDKDGGKVPGTGTKPENAQASIGHRFVFYFSINLNFIFTIQAVSQLGHSIHSPCHTDLFLSLTCGIIEPHCS